jgi:CBS domain-containing protein
VGFVRGERTVKKLRLSKALTIPDGTTVSEACKMMAVRRVDAVLLTDANDLLSGILTDKVSCVPSVESVCNFWCLIEGL